MKTNKKIFFFLTFIFLFFILDSCQNNNIQETEETSNIVLCFDDYWESWDKIISSYEDVTFNFFISSKISAYPDNKLIISMVENGHSVNNHSIPHQDLPTVPKEDREEFLNKQILEQNKILETYGIKCENFAFPSGAFDRDWELRLLPHFKHLRRFGTTNNEPYYITNEDYKKRRIVPSSSIDNTKFTTDELFYSHIDKMLEELSHGKYTVVLTTHGIGNINDFPWGITEERLDYLIKHAKEKNIKFIKM